MTQNQKKEQQIDPKVMTKLIDRLDSYPVGLPDASEIREFFELYLEADEAHLASIFPMREVTAQELAKRIKWPIEKVEKLLDSMACKGIVIDFKISKRGDHSYWMLSASVVGFIEFSMMKVHNGMPTEKIAQVLDAYEQNHLWQEVFSSKTPIARTLITPEVPVDSTIKTTAEIIELINKAGIGAIQDCYCRHHKHLLGEDCKVTTHKDSCFTIGKKATDFIVRRGFGREATAEELIEKVKEFDKLGLIHVTDNIRNRPGFICNCCGCCCGLLSGIVDRNIPHTVSPTDYIIDVDYDKCNGCEACSKKCQIKALSVENKKIKIDLLNCLGCGACTNFCKQNALKLVKRKNKPHIPKDATEKYMRVAWEKKKLFRLLWARFKAKFW